MLGCGKFLSFGAEFVVQQVVELLRARPLVVSVAGVRVEEFGTKRQTDQHSFRVRRSCRLSIDDANKCCNLP